MKLIPSTVRSCDHFAEGNQGFILNAQNCLGDSRQAAEESIRNYETYGKSWAPAKFIRFVVDHRAEGCFEFKTEEILSWGTQQGTCGDRNPMIVHREEMIWLKEAIGRLGTSDYGAITKKAIEGNDDALIIVGYFETAYEYITYERFTEYARSGKSERSCFVKEQFLDAVSRCEA